METIEEKRAIYHPNTVIIDNDGDAHNLGHIVSIKKLTGNEISGTIALVLITAEDHQILIQVCTAETVENYDELFMKMTKIRLDIIEKWSKRFDGEVFYPFKTINLKKK